jgi:hypothetical protein
MNYRARTAAIRSTREREYQRIWSEAAEQVTEVRSARDREMARVREASARQLAEARAERDAEIRRLTQADPSLSLGAIAARSGCSKDVVYEILHPEKHALWTVRRREYWRRPHLRAVA